MSLTYIFDDDIRYFYNFLSRTEIEDDMVSYNQYLRPYATSINSYMTLLNQNILGIGFLPINKNSDKYFYGEKYHQPEVTQAPYYEDTFWYQQLQENNTSVIFTTTFNHIENIISIVRVSKNIDMKKDLGYIIVDVSMDFIYNLLDNLSISKNSGIILFSPANKFLFSTNDKLLDYADQLSPNVTHLSFNQDFYDIYNYTDNSSGFTFYYLSSKKDLVYSYGGALLLILAFYGFIAVQLNSFMPF